MFFKEELESCSLVTCTVFITIIGVLQNKFLRVKNKKLKGNALFVFVFFFCPDFFLMSKSSLCWFFFTEN